MAKTKGNGNGKLTEERFVTNAIKNLRNGGYKGIHTRFSGFNQAFRNYYGTDPVTATKELVEKGVISCRPCRGGVMIYLASDAPATPAPGAAALAKILN